MNSDRRRRLPPNRFGCKPSEDVCVEHDDILICGHGCEAAKEHACKDLRELETAKAAHVEELLSRRTK